MKTVLFQQKGSVVKKRNVRKQWLNVWEMYVITFGIAISAFIWVNEGCTKSNANESSTKVGITFSY